SHALSFARTFGPHPTTMCRSNLPADMQAQPHARQAKSTGVRAGSEWLEDALFRPWRQPDTGVTDGQHDPIESRSQSHVDLSAVGGVLDRVAEEIVHDLPQPAGVSNHGRCACQCLPTCPV